MKTGILWFCDGEEQSLSEKIGQAAHHYEAKYGIRPDLVFVNPSMLLGQAINVPGIAIKSTNMILPNHLWLGRSQDAQRPIVGVEDER